MYSKTLFTIAFSTLICHYAIAQWRPSYVPSQIPVGFINCLSHDGSFVYAGFGYFTTNSTGGGMLVSSDNGVTWGDLDSGQIGSSVYTIAAQGNVMYAGAGYVIYDLGDTNTTSLWRSLDGGTTWSELKMKRGYEKLFSLALHGTELFATTETQQPDIGALLRSDDSGASWEVLADSAYGSGEFGSLQFGGTKIFAGTGSRGLVVSPDSGQTWENVGLPFGTIVTQLVAKDSVIVALLGAPDYFNRQNDTGEFIAYSTDYGGAWHENQLSVGQEIQANNFAFDGRYLYASTGGSIGRESYSRDTGKTWQDISPANPSDGPNLIMSLLVTTDDLLAGSTETGSTERGIWYYPLSSLSVSSSTPEISSASVYPNPSAGPIVIRGAAGSVEVTNLLGERVAGSGNRAPGSVDVELALSWLPSGMYFVHITTSDGIVVRKILKE